MLSEALTISNGNDYIALNFPVPKISLTNKARLHILPSQKIMCTIYCTKMADCFANYAL
jgi:hypothetical protein